MAFRERAPHIRAGLMTPVVLIGAVMSGVTGPALGEFGIAFAGGMLVHGRLRGYFSWLHFRRGAGALWIQAIHALARGLVVMLLCYIGCVLAVQAASLLHSPGAELCLQALWSGILIDSMLVVDDEDQGWRRRRASSSKLRDLFAPAPVAIPG